MSLPLLTHLEKQYKNTPYIELTGFYLSENTAFLLGKRLLYLFSSAENFMLGKYENANLKISCASYTNHVYLLSVQMICA